MKEELLRQLSAVTDEERQILKNDGSIDLSLYTDGSRDIISGDKLLSPGKMIRIRPHTRFTEFPEHTHDYVEMVYMCSGRTIHRINGSEIILEEGELLMLGQNARQWIAPAGMGDIAVNFIVRPEFFSATLPFLGEEETPLRSFLVNCLMNGSETGYLLFHVSGILPVQNLLENLVYSLLEDVPNKRGILQHTMGLLFIQLLNHTEMLEFEAREQSMVVSVLRYLEEHYREGSLSEIAGNLHYELSSLSRLIRKKTGRNFKELLQEKRLSQAAWLLRNSDRTVEEIALSVGYENQSYFYRLFTGKFGMSPRKYRQNNRADLQG